jgi:hypothetical protein
MPYQPRHRPPWKLERKVDMAVQRDLFTAQTLLEFVT